MSLGIVFALEAEQGCFEDLLVGVKTVSSASGKIRSGTLDGLLVTTIVAGAGAAKAAGGTRALLLGHKPRQVISAGFCGGLQPGVKRYDVLVAERFIAADGTSREADAAFRNTLRVPEGCTRPWTTVDRIVSQSAAKQSLGERTGAWACEMESAAVAEVCAERGVPFLAVRAVSDPVDEDLPPDLDPLMTATSTAGLLGAVVGTLWRRPTSVKDLLRLKEHALVAADKLAQFLAMVAGQLPREQPQALDDGT